MIFVGIDPGIEGGIGIIDEDNNAVAYKYTSAKLIEITKHFKEHHSDVKFYVEQVHAMPHQGVKSMFTFGSGFGKILGILEALNAEYYLVKPQSWKKGMHVTADKATSIAKCKELYPTTCLKPTTRCRVDHDGLAEAVLIAAYGKKIARNK